MDKHNLNNYSDNDAKPIYGICVGGAWHMYGPKRHQKGIISAELI